jgi:hypothetical protein
MVAIAVLNKLKMDANKALRDFRENNHPVRTGFVDYIVALTDTWANPPLQQ